MTTLSKSLIKTSCKLLSSSSKQLLPLTTISISHFATWKGTYLGPGPCDMDLDDGGQKPDGVPDTWTATDIWTDYGRFDEDTFPVALVKSIHIIYIYLAKSHYILGRRNIGRILSSSTKCVVTM